MQELLQQLDVSLDQVENKLRTLSKHRLEILRKVAARVIDEKYPHRKGRPLYGNVPRVFKFHQLKGFFEELARYKNKDVRDSFLLVFFYALRISELGSISLVPGQELVRVVNKKCNRIEYLPLIPGTKHLFRQYNKGKGYDPNYLRKYFRETCDRLGDEFMYEYATDRAGKQRKQFSTHTLRKTAGNMLRTQTGDPYKEAIYLRHETHRLFGATAAYMHYGLEDMQADLEKTFCEVKKVLL